jgi:hypothetical protein
MDVIAAFKQSKALSATPGAVRSRRYRQRNGLERVYQVPAPTPVIATTSAK